MKNILLKKYDLFSLYSGLIALPLFIINPLVGLLFLIAMYQLLASNKPNYVILFLFISVFLGIINASKQPESDLETYLKMYQEVKYHNLLGYILILGKEPAFSMINYLFYYLFDGNEKLYVFSLTVIGYFILFTTVRQYYEKNAKGKKEILFAVVLMGFFPQFFSLSAHVIRQFLASAFIFHFVINRIFYRRNCWSSLVLAVLTHSTTMFFIPLLFFKPLKNKFSPKNIILSVTTIFLFSILLFKVLIPIFTKINIPLISYVFMRLSQNQFYELAQMPLIAFILIGFLVLFSLFLYKKINITNELVWFINIFLVFVIFIVATSFDTSMIEITNRFYFYTYCFMPLIVPLCLSTKNPMAIRFLSMGVYCIIFGMLIYIEYFGAWKYASIINILLNTMVDYF